MDFFSLDKPVNKKKLAAGQLLIAEPYLADPNFARCVVLLCEHGEDGSVGFVINRPTQLTLGDLLPEIYTPEIGVFQGGPVQLDTLHMLHRIPDAFGGNRISDSVFWGGSYEALQDAVTNNTCQPVDIRLFVGYSGWSPGQLDKEVDDGAWLIADVSEDILFETEQKEIWKAAIKHMGREYEYLANLPLNPQLN